MDSYNKLAVSQHYFDYHHRCKMAKTRKENLYMMMNLLFNLGLRYNVKKRSLARQSQNILNPQNIYIMRTFSPQKTLWTHICLDTPKLFTHKICSTLQKINHLVNSDIGPTLYFLYKAKNFRQEYSSRLETNHAFLIMELDGT